MSSKSSIGGPLFKEYLGYIDAASSMVPSGSIGPLTNEDCLLVIDMQNDFISAHPEKNSDNSRFASSESEDIVLPICALMEAFHGAGGLVIATKDYHPWDHCSFIGHTDVNFAPRKNQIFGQSAGFPPHCVQGNSGCNFYKDIRDTLCKLMREDNARLAAAGRSCGQARMESRAQVAWKGFNEAVDSFGGVEYEPDSSLGRFKDVYKKSPCQLSCWTGAVILKASCMCWTGDTVLQPENVDAPPDILAMNFSNCPTPVHDFVRRKGCKRVFVCGLVLDCCVIDTCLNAISKGFETYMIIDSARAAHVKGFGAYGEGFALGFVNDPIPVKEWIQKSKLPLVPTNEILPEKVMEELWTKGVPQLATETDSEEGFPSKLQLSIREARHEKLKVIKSPTATEGGTYSVADSPEMATLQVFGFHVEGNLSPLSDVTLSAEEKQNLALTADSVKFAFAYPVKGSENIAKIRESSPHTCQCFTAANLFFACFGGYLYFNSSDELVGCLAIGGGSSGVDGGTSHKYIHNLQKEADWTDDGLIKDLHSQQRFSPVTIPALEASGVKAFAWVLPNEGTAAPSKNGGFVYLYHDPSNPAPEGASKPIFFTF